MLFHRLSEDVLQLLLGHLVYLERKPLREPVSLDLQGLAFPHEFVELLRTCVSKLSPELPHLLVMAVLEQRKVPLVFEDDVKRGTVSENVFSSPFKSLLH